RTLAGSDCTMRCSRLDLFQTGMTSTPRSAANWQAWSCALACWAKRSPTPMENRPSLTTSFIVHLHDSPTAANRQAQKLPDLVHRSLNILHPSRPVVSPALPRVTHGYCYRPALPNSRFHSDARG